MIYQTASTAQSIYSLTIPNLILKMTTFFSTICPISGVVTRKSFNYTSDQKQNCCFQHLGKRSSFCSLWNGPVYLGVIISKDFKWSTHIAYLCSKMNCAPHSLGRIVPFIVSRSTKFNIHPWGLSYLYDVSQRANLGCLDWSLRKLNNCSEKSSQKGLWESGFQTSLQMRLILHRSVTLSSLDKGFSSASFSTV